MANCTETDERTPGEIAAHRWVMKLVKRMAERTSAPPEPFEVCRCWVERFERLRARGIAAHLPACCPRTGSKGF